MKELLKKHFGYDEFRPLQEEIIASVTQKHDTFVLMPTGGGKSMCYQLPALQLPGLTLVISPLIALMKDQVDALQANGISAEFINSSLEYDDIEEIKERCRKGTIKILYIAPERLALSEFSLFLQALPISLIAIDEAHCISEWGHDFRPDYRTLRTLKSTFPNTPLIALTATATPRVQEDIIDQLSFVEPQVFISSFDRNNLKLSIIQKNNALEKLLTLVNRHQGESVIVYCFSRKETEQVSDELRLRGFKALPYHAGLSPETRKLNQELFITDKVDIMVATIAFGMGIDKPDVRLVVHYSLPKSIEGYYQEIGRAGRDGLDSECVLFYSQGDKRKQEFFFNEISDPDEKKLAEKKLNEVIQYCESISCRRKYILHYFGEEFTKNNCDACDMCHKPESTFDATEIVKTIIRATQETGNRFGQGHIIKVLHGSRIKKIVELGHDKLSTFGTLKQHSEETFNHLFKYLIAHQFLKKEPGQYPTITITSIGNEFLKSSERFMIPEFTQTTSSAQKDDEDIEYDIKLFNSLRELRRQLADKRGVPPFVILGDKALQQMSYYFPRTRDALLNVSGFGEKKLQDFGDLFLGLIERYCTTYNIESKPMEVKYRLAKRHGIAKYMITKEMVDAKEPLDKIAEAQDLKPATIMNHIIRLHEAGQVLDVSYLQTNSDSEKEIWKAFETYQSEFLKPIFDKFNGKYSYDELKLVQMLRKLTSN